MQEKDEEYSRDALDDPGDDSGSAAVPEEEQFTTKESDEQGERSGEESPKEGDPQVDDLGDDNGSEALSEGEQFTTDESDEQGERSGEESPKEGDPQVLEKRYRGKWWIAFSIALLLCLVTGVGYLYMRDWRSAKGYRQTEESPQRYRLAIPKDQLLLFPSFVIPFHGDHKFAYISLSISFNVPSNELKEEMRDKESLLRGIISDMLTVEVNKVKEIPSLKTIKELILSEVNTVLFTGKVHEVYITNFLAV